MSAVILYLTTATVCCDGLQEKIRAVHTCVQKIKQRCHDCDEIVEIEIRNLRRHHKIYETDTWSCQGCINRRIAKDRRITDQERKSRAARATAQWRNIEVRKKMMNGLKRARERR